MKTYLPGLNTVRFCAALKVLLIHFIFSLSSETRWHYLGPNAVTMFFVLSGYLITYRLLLERQETGRINLKAFYIRRELRILPLYYLAAIVGGFILPLIGAPAPSTDAMLTILFLVPQFTHAYSIPSGVMIPMWSIGVEEVFYLFFPAAMRVLSVTWVSIGVIVTSTVISLIASSPHSSLFLLFPLFRAMRFECMAVGALAAWLIVSKSRWLFVVYHRVIEVMAIGLLILLTLFNVSLSLPFYDLIFSIVVAVFLVNISTNPRPILRLEWSWSKAAGELSYGIYIWHFPILWFFTTILSGLPLLLATVVGTLIVAWGSYRFIEKPMLGLKDRFQHKPASLKVSVDGYGAAQAVPIVRHNEIS